MEEDQEKGHSIRSKMQEMQVGFQDKKEWGYQARLVVCGYSQIPGADFTKNYSPVVHGITYHLLLIANMICGLSAKIVNVEAAFLYRDLSEEIFMNCPEGLDGATDQDALKLQK